MSDVQGDPGSAESAARAVVPSGAPAGPTVDEQVTACVEYVFDKGFAGDVEERNAFVDAFRKGGRYGSFNVLRSDFDKARPQDPDYLVLHEVHAALSVLPEADREVALKTLGIALLARQAIELLAQPRG